MDNQGIMSLAAQGRGGDTILAHLRPGELVLPPEVLEPSLVKQLEKKLQDKGFGTQHLLRVMRMCQSIQLLDYLSLAFLAS